MDSVTFCFGSAKEISLAEFREHFPACPECQMNSQVIQLVQSFSSDPSFKERIITELTYAAEMLRRGPLISRFGIELGKC